MAKKKPEIKIVKRGQRCGKGWTSIEIKIGKTTKRACIRGKVRVPDFWERMPFWQRALFSITQV